MTEVLLLCGVQAADEVVALQVPIAGSDAQDDFASARDTVMDFRSES
jgi:hypothetical protein